MNEIKTRKWGLSRVLVIEFLVIAILFGVGMLIQANSPTLSAWESRGGLFQVLAFLFGLLIIPPTLMWKIPNKIIKIVAIVIYLGFLWSLFNIINTPIGI